MTLTTLPPDIRRNTSFLGIIPKDPNTPRLGKLGVLIIKIFRGHEPVDQGPLAAGAHQG